MGYSGGILCGIGNAACHDTLTYTSKYNTDNSISSSNFVGLLDGSLSAPEPGSAALCLAGAALAAIASRRRQRVQ